MIGEELVNIMLEDGVKISNEEKDKVAKTIDEAAKDERIVFLEKDGNKIGFITYNEKDDGIFITYGFIYKKFKGMFNFLSLRRSFRKLFGTRFRWRSRRRNKYCDINLRRCYEI